jgi:hypothetical protein
MYSLNLLKNFLKKLLPVALVLVVVGVWMLGVKADTDRINSAADLRGTQPVCAPVRTVCGVATLPVWPDGGLALPR